MASNVPIVRQIAWLSTIPHILIIGLLIYIYRFLGSTQPIIWGALTMLLLSFGLKALIVKQHLQGIDLVKQQKFAEAIPYFERSVAYFSKNAWIDKYRFLTLLSSSKMGYREMGLCNIAFCYGQIGNGAKAKTVYQQVLNEYPDNGLAGLALNMLNSVDKND